MSAQAMELGKKLLASARPECLRLATSFHAAMPREIRDRVYSFLREPELQLGTLLGYTEGGKDEIPHWFCPAFVGLDFARECAQIHYEETTFLFHEDVDFSDIYSSLNTDHYALGLEPSSYIRSCRVVLDAESLSWIFSIKEFEKCKQEMEGLLSLKHRCATVEFGVDMETWAETPRLFTLALSVQLQGAEARVHGSHPKR
jgi:hypothetical protein